jgi:sigma-B regulation protein RsbU (phosphoserine phosphatase)
LQHEKSAKFIDTSGLPIGIITEANYESVQMTYCPGDRFFLYSDGITECESPSGDMFGTERLRLFIDETRHLKISEVTRQLDEQIRLWHGTDSFEDDISMLVLEVC